MRNKQQNLTQAGAVLLFSAIIVKLIGALFKIPLSADYALGDLGFGYFSSVYDLYIPIYTLALSGFPVAIARMIADFVGKKDFESEGKIFNLSFKMLILLGVLGSSIFFVVSLPLIISDNKQGLGYSLLAVAPAMIFCCITSVYRGYFEGHKNMIPTAISNIIEALGKLILGLSGAIITIRLTNNAALASAAALLGITIGTLISCLYLRHSFKKDNTISININERVYDRELSRKLISFLLPIAVASLSVGITAFIDSLTLKPQLEAVLLEDSANAHLLLKETLYSKVKPSEIPTLLYGIKGKAYTLFNLVPTLTTALGVGAVPLITECFAKNDIEDLKQNTNLCLKFSSVLSFPIAFGFMFMGEGITALLYGERSAMLGGKLLAFYGIAALFAGLSVPSTSLLQAASRQKTALINIVIGLAVKLSCNIVLTAVPQINVCGAAIGTAVCFMVIFLLNMIFIVRAFGFVPGISQVFLKPLLAAFACGGTAFIVKTFVNSGVGTVISIAVAAFVYIALLWLLNVIEKEEILQLIKH